MKKIVYGYDNNTFLHIFDPKDYIIIESYGQHISDKYVDYDGKKINGYDMYKKNYRYFSLKKGNIVIREFYQIWFGDSNDISVGFRKFKYYDINRDSDEHKFELKQGIRMKNSIFDFNHIKKRIVEIFSRNIEIEIS